MIILKAAQWTGNKRAESKLNAVEEAKQDGGEKADNGYNFRQFE